jgi:CheY-like chemotaxis protein
MDGLLNVLEVAREFHPDVILLDIGLPDLKGYEIARQLKWEPGLEKTRMIAISGLSEDEQRRLAIEAGCEDLLVKPLSPSVLEELLARPQS